MYWRIFGRDFGVFPGRKVEVIYLPLVSGYGEKGVLKRTPGSMAGGRCNMKQAIQAIVVVVLVVAGLLSAACTIPVLSDRDVFEEAVQEGLAECGYTRREAKAAAIDAWERLKNVDTELAQRLYRLIAR